MFKNWSGDGLVIIWILQDLRFQIQKGPETRGASGCSPPKNVWVELLRDNSCEGVARGSIMVRKELLMSPPWPYTWPPSSSFPRTLQSKCFGDLKGSLFITRKAASGWRSSHSGPYAGQTAYVGHPCRVHGICPPSLGLGFQHGAGAKAPQLSKEIEKREESKCQNPHFFSPPLFSRAGYSGHSSQLSASPTLLPSYLVEEGKMQLDRWEKEHRWPRGWEQHSPTVTMGLWYGRSPKESWWKPCP